MSRLDLSIRRLKAQRACLNLAAALIRDLPGPVFELGLGNGRSYDHLRAVLPGREIFAFDREVAAHPDCIPDETRLYLGDLYDTLPRAAERFGRRVALVHADVGSAGPERDKRLARFIARQLPAVLLAGGVVAADRDMAFAGGQAIALPEGLEPGVYFMYRLDPAAAHPAARPAPDDADRGSAPGATE
ncbi:MAG: class I SAM-dependent methyltransferase [Kiloniellaceae bacterium]